MNTELSLLPSAQSYGKTNLNPVDGGQSFTETIIFLRYAPC
jgi:hypothetical protein